MSVLKVTPIDAKISKYFRSMVFDTVNYRERNNVTRNDFLQLLIQIKNKGKVDEENEIPEMNGYGTSENKFNEDGMYAQCVLFLVTFSTVFARQIKHNHNVKPLSQIPSQFSFHSILLGEKKSISGTFLSVFSLLTLDTYLLTFSISICQ
jgi:hypothetical protein